jgi:N-acetylmuramoyl-L-alanine amidase
LLTFHYRIFGEVVMSRALLVNAAVLLSALLCHTPASAQQPSESWLRGYAPGDPPLSPPAARVNEWSGRSEGLRTVRTGAFFSQPARGALSGKTVYLSPGHGWTYTTSNGWGTQRGNTFDIVEDLSNLDGVSHFLVPYLWAAGAQVMPVREIDATAEMVIVDDSDGTQNPTAGVYRESGDSAQFLDSTLSGYGHPTLPLTSGTNPFALGKNRLIKTSSQETARATFVPAVPKSGYYNVYISYSMYEQRAPDARIIVKHPGGQTIYLVDQRRHGGTWVLLGRHYFELGSDSEKGAIAISNQSGTAGSTVSVDAVRLGGGMGLFDRGGGVSQQTRADECARYHAQFSGAPASVYNASSSDDRTDDVSTRSRFAAWLHQPGEESVFVSHHSNASGANARGTVTYVYGRNPVDGSYKPTAETLALGSDKLARAIHDAMVADIRAAIDPTWKDRGLKSAYFGELNTSNQNEMPAALLEVAFHDQADDAEMLKSPLFRQLVARAIYKGIVRFFAERDGSAPALLPEPPVQLRAQNTGAGEVTVGWRPGPSGGIYGDPARDYRVYRSEHGFAFDHGVDTGGVTRARLTGLEPGKVYYIRVIALNDGGQSLPSPTLAVSVPQPGMAPSVLLVGGFDRFDRALNLRPTYKRLGTVDRLRPERSNDKTHLVYHGRALAQAGLAFDSTWVDALEATRAQQGRYGLILYHGGRGASPDERIPKSAQSVLLSAAAAGSRLIISGSGIAQTLLDAPAASPGAQLAAVFGLMATESAPRAGVEFSLSEVSNLGPSPLSTLQSGPYPTGPADALQSTSSPIARYDDSKTAGIEANRCQLFSGFHSKRLQTSKPEAR